MTLKLEGEIVLDASCCAGILAFTFFVATLAINIALQILLFSLTVTLFLLAAGEGGNPNVMKVATSFHSYCCTVSDKYLEYMMPGEYGDFGTGPAVVLSSSKAKIALRWST